MFPLGQGILHWLCSFTRGDYFLPVFCFNFLSTFGIQFFLSCKVQSFWRKSTCLKMKLHTGFYSMSSGTFFPNKEIAETWIHRNRSEEVINRSPMRSNIIPVAHNVGAQANCTTMSCPAAGLRAGHGHAWIETLAIWKSKSKISRSIYQPRGSRYLGCCFRSSFVLPTNPKKNLS